jgi:hypothetical protein
MDQPVSILDWYWRMPLESAFAELWLAKGDLSQARLENFIVFLLDGRFRSQGSGLRLLDPNTHYLKTG